MRIAILGDSIMRYQYLALATYLKTGEWVPEDLSKPSAVMEKTHASWTSFYEATNAALRPHEVCDCFRREPFDTNKICENRYYFDASRGISVSYIQAFGSVKSHGHLQPDRVHHAEDLESHGGPLWKRPELTPVVWEYGWQETITKHLEKLVPKPNVLVLNAGLWTENEFGKDPFRREVLAAAEAAGMISVWQTTTFNKGHALPTPHTASTDAAMCKAAKQCLDMSWSKDLPSDAYGDEKHFKVSTVNKMAQQMLAMVRSAAALWFKRKCRPAG